MTKKVSKVKINKSIVELFELEALLMKLDKAPSFRFQIVLAKNLKTISEETNLIREKGKMPDDLKTILNKENDVKAGFANKDDDGLPSTVESMDGDRMVKNYDIPEEKHEELEVALKEFWAKDGNKEAREAATKLLEDYMKYVNTERIDLELHVFPSEDSIGSYFVDNLELLRHFANIAEEIIDL